MSVMPAPRELRQEDGKVKANLSITKNLVSKPKQQPNTMFDFFNIFSRTSGKRLERRVEKF